MGKCPFCNADVENHDMKEHFIENHPREVKEIENSDEDNDVNAQKHNFTPYKFQKAGFKIQRRKSGTVDLFESHVDDPKDPIYNLAKGFKIQRRRTNAMDLFASDDDDPKDPIYSPTKDKDISDGNSEAENQPIGRGIKRVKSGPIYNSKKLKRSLFSSRMSSKKLIHKKIKKVESEDAIPLLTETDMSQGSSGEEDRTTGSDTIPPKLNKKTRHGMSSKKIVHKKIKKVASEDAILLLTETDMSQGSSGEEERTMCSDTIRVKPIYIPPKLNRKTRHASVSSESVIHKRKNSSELTSEEACAATAVNEIAENIRNSEGIIGTDETVVKTTYTEKRINKEGIAKKHKTQALSIASKISRKIGLHIQAKQEITRTLRSGQLLQRWAIKDRAKHRPRMKQRITKRETPSRKPKKCPHCILWVQNLPRHLRTAHDLTLDESLIQSRALKGGIQKIGKRRRYKCPVAGCERIVQIMIQHLHQMHGLTGSDARYINRLKRHESSRSSSEMEEGDEEEVEAFDDDDEVALPSGPECKSIHETARNEKDRQLAIDTLQKSKKSPSETTVVFEDDQGAIDDTSNTTEITTETNVDCVYTFWNQHHLLKEYYAFQTSLDKGRSAEAAIQHCKHIFMIWSSIDPQMKIESILDGQKIKNEFFEPIKKKVQPGTKKSYVGSLRDLWSFMRTNDVIDDFKDFTKLFMQSSMWITTLNKQALVRRTELRVEESRNRIAPSDVKLFLESVPATLAIQTIDDLVYGDVLPKERYCLIRNFLMLMICICNAQRSGSVRGITMRAFRNTDVRENESIIYVSKHKTAATRGPVTLVLNINLWRWLKIFVKYGRKQIPNFDAEMNEDDAMLFLAYPNNTRDKAVPITSSVFNNGIKKIWSMVHTNKISATKIRKSVTTSVRSVAPGERDALAQQMTHRAATADQYYLLDQRTEDAVRVVGLITNVMTMIDPDNWASELNEGEDIVQNNSNDASLEEGTGSVVAPDSIDSIMVCSDNAPIEERDTPSKTKKKVSTPTTASTPATPGSFIEVSTPTTASTPGTPRSFIEVSTPTTASTPGTPGSFIEHGRRAFDKNDSDMILKICEVMIQTGGGITSVRIMDTLSACKEGRLILRKYKEIYPDYPKRIADRVRTARRQYLKKNRDSFPSKRLISKTFP